MPYIDYKDITVDFPSIPAGGFTTKVIDLIPLFGPGNIFPPCLATPFPPAGAQLALFFEGRIVIPDSLTLIVVNRGNVAIDLPNQVYKVRFEMP